MEDGAAQKHGQVSIVCNMTNEAPEWNGLEQIVALPAFARQVTLSGWMKSVNIVGQDQYGGAYLALEFLDNSRKVVGEYQPPAGVCIGSVPWQYYHQNYFIPPEATRVKIMCLLLNASGSAILR